MIRNTSRRSTAVALFLVALFRGAAATAQQPPEQATVVFSDPSRPGTLKVQLVQGSVTVHAENRRDVGIEARTRGDVSAARRQPDAATGLRRLTPAGGFDVTEERNEMTIESSNVNRLLDFDIRVPIRTTLRLDTVNSGTVLVDGIEGELEINNVNGSITLTNIAGPVVANTVNGKVLATITRITAGKAMAFTSLNGSVDVTLPPSAKANLKLRSDRGDVFTDFDIQLQPSAAPKIEDTRRNNGRFRLEVNSAITGTINGGGPEIEMRSYNAGVYLRKGK